ncbi:MAG: MarR family transcriptional regulator [Firmicutes bacterium]|nr:MarR family transcriptional regulator [Bacillota bacterium]
MQKKAEKIAELIGMLPLFMGLVLEGIEIATPFPLNESEEKTLMFLHKNEGSPMTEYSKKVGLSKGSFTGVVDRLVEKGLVKRTSVSDDRRVYALILTEKGKETAKDIDLQFKQHIAKKLTYLPDEDLRALKKALAIIAATIEKFQAGKG